MWIWSHSLKQFWQLRTSGALVITPRWLGMDVLALIRQLPDCVIADPSTVALPPRLQKPSAPHNTDDFLCSFTFSYVFVAFNIWHPSLLCQATVESHEQDVHFLQPVN